MVVIIGVAILILGITYYQAIQGLFSSMIMAILTVLCAAVAVNFYEPVASALLYTRQPAYADAIALTALFVLPLLALRLTIDKLIGGNVVLDRWMDRVGGGVAGLITSIILVGIFILAVQMLPFNASLIGYQPFNETLQREDRLVPFYPDEFTIGLGSMFSDGAFGGKRSFARAHDNLLLELFCWRNRPEKERKIKGRRIRKGPKSISSRLGRVDAQPGDLRGVEAAYQCEPEHIKKWREGDVHPLLTQEPLPHEESNGQRGELRKIIVIRTSVAPRAREDKSAGAAVDWWLLPATQFRLVSEGGKSFYPVGYLTYLDPEKAKEEAERYSLAKPQMWRFIAADLHPDDKTGTQWLFTELMVEREWSVKDNELVVDWVYRVPKEEVPGYMVFRRVAKCAVPEVKVLSGKEADKPLFPKGFADKVLDRRM